MSLVGAVSVVKALFSLVARMGVGLISPPVRAAVPEHIHPLYWSFKIDGRGNYRSEIRSTYRARLMILTLLLTFDASLIVFSGPSAELSSQVTNFPVSWFTYCPQWHLTRCDPAFRPAKTRPSLYIYRLRVPLVNSLLLSVPAYMIINSISLALDYF